MNLNLPDIAKEMTRLSRLIDQGVTALVDQSKALADAEEAYRKGRQHLFAAAPKGTVPEKEAWVDGESAELRRARDLAEHLRVAALEALRSRRTQLSALQSLMNAFKEDEAFHRFGPEAA